MHFCRTGRLHLHHGPIDLVIDAEGPGRNAAFHDAGARFRTVLDELATELTLLRQPLVAWPEKSVARRMAQAVAPFTDQFVTPMAAVAGAVAEEILTVMRQHELTRAHVNNGGDVAFHLFGEAEMTAMSAVGEIRIRASDATRGVATSGWRGRSHSLGIADSVTVLASCAAAADVAATLIANAVDLPGHPAITRTPATEVSPDSDLGARPVTVAVGSLRPDAIDVALASGLRFAEECRARGLIHSACITLNNTHRISGQAGLAAPAPEHAHA